MGLRSCYDCKGNGWINEEEGYVEFCSACMGKGKVHCRPVTEKPPCTNGCGKLTNHMSGICQPCRSLKCKCGKKVAPSGNKSRIECYTCFRKKEQAIAGAGQWLFG